MLAATSQGKVIFRSFPSIGHLPGSKMINDEDKVMGNDMVTYLTERRHKSIDLVIVTEKVDGSNCAVYKKDNIPINEKRI